MPIFKLWIVSYIVDVYFPDAVLADVFPLLLLFFCLPFCFVVFSPRTACTHSRKGCCKYLVEWWWLKSSVWNWNRYKLSFVSCQQNNYTAAFRDVSCGKGLHGFVRETNNCSPSMPCFWTLVLIVTACYIQVYNYLLFCLYFERYAFPIIIGAHGCSFFPPHWSLGRF